MTGSLPKLKTMVEPLHFLRKPPLYAEILANVNVCQISQPASRTFCRICQLQYSRTPHNDRPYRDLNTYNSTRRSQLEYRIRFELQEYEQISNF